MKNTKIVIWVLAAVVVVGLGALIVSPQSGVENVDDAKMQELVAEGVRVVDVRTPAEYEMGHLPGAEIVPINQFQAVAQEWDRSQPLAVYCATGDRSVPAVEMLTQMGFEQVYHFNAGMIAWSGQVERGQAVAVAPATEPETLDSPVLYEFYTDW